MSHEIFDIRPEVRAALAGGQPVVGLETTVLAHGLPRPVNLEAARRMEAAVRAEGAVPATVGVIGGRLVVGLDGGELERFAAAEEVAKVSLRDLAAAVAGGGLGATTVAGTLFAAAEAGLAVAATGGLGGVHRGALETFDLSADLTVLARSPVAVVCSGAKAVLDLPRTLEALETLGVPVVGYGTGELPAFYSRTSGLALPHRVDSPGQAARLLAAQRALGLAAVVFAQPPPEREALPAAEVEGWIAEALAAAGARGVSGKEVTPFLLDHLAEASGGRTVAANVALLEANARLAAQIAAEWSAGGLSAPARG